MNNKQRSVLLALFLAAATPVFAQQPPAGPHAGEVLLPARDLPTSPPDTKP